MHLPVSKHRAAHAPLPVEEHLPAIRAHLAQDRAVVVVAAPGAGKTTRLPPALLDAGRLILLQPRRVAARAVVHRMAEEQGWTVGQEIGWQIRFERRFSAATRLLVVTEGILTARLLRDPLLSEFSTVVVDEFHERSIHADVGLALVRQAWLARHDLRIVVMSATLDADPVARFLGDCAVIRVAATPHPLTIEYAAGQSMAAAVRELAPTTSGATLCFLPGAREIARTIGELSSFASAAEIDLLALHGSMAAANQDEALRPATRRRVILATNIAETSITVPDVTTVIDSGLVKVARYDAERGIDSLTLERIARDSATQRAGRAGRLGPGRVRRLWHEHDRLRELTEPEISRVDVSGPVLQLLAWGATPEAFEWFEQPPPARLSAALSLLRRLGALDEREPIRAALSSIGQQLGELPVPPRLGRILIAGRGSRLVARACALLTSTIAPVGATTTSCDLLPWLDSFDQQPSEIRALADTLDRMSESFRDHARGAPTHMSLERALLAGFGDRVAKRRGAGLDRYTLATGHGASLARESGVGGAEFLIALRVASAEREGIGESRIGLASRIDREWLSPTSESIEHTFDPSSGRVRAARVARYDALVLSEVHVPADPTVAAQLLCDAWLGAPRSPEEAQLLRRLRFADVDVDVQAMARAAAARATTLQMLDIEAELDHAQRRALERGAPASITVPSGRTLPLVYEHDGSVSLSVKLQELFGLAHTPKLGPRSVPLTLYLLAPNGQPVQTTRDLQSFWTTTYADVRKTLRGRYPKHPWPEDPWSAPPTHRTLRQRR